MTSPAKLARKQTLLDKVRERNEAAGSLLTNAAALAQGMQAAGAASALAGGAGAVAGAVFSLAGIAVGLMVASFQNSRMREEFEFIAQCIDELPATWAEDGTLDEYILPAVMKHLMWRTQENHREKVQAARTHLRKKLLDGEPTGEQDHFHQQVESFLNACTVSELICLIRLALAFRTREHFDQTGENQGHPAILEEELVSRTGLRPQDGYYAFRELEGRGLVFGDLRTGRESRPDYGPLPAPVDEGMQRFWSLTALGRRIAEWLDTAVPPESSPSTRNGGKG
jgi:hypothetical protein